MGSFQLGLKHYPVLNIHAPYIRNALGYLWTGLNDPINDVCAGLDKLRCSSPTPSIWKFSKLITYEHFVCIAATAPHVQERLPSSANLL